MGHSVTQAYLALAEYMAMFLMLCGSTFLCVLVLRQQYKTKQSISHMLTTYLYVILVQNVAAISNVVYMMAFWKVDPIYNGIIVYFTGILTLTAVVHYEVATFFLFLERIFTLRFALWFMPKRHKWLTICSFVFGPLTFAPMVWLSLQSPIQRQTKTGCWAINCATENLNSFYFICTKIVLAVLNCVAGFVFVFSIRRYRQITVASTTTTIGNTSVVKQKKVNVIIQI
ncbi:hypothetical protein L596_026853 [Steinernema carpocapsae]|uniref:Uncharacterized protein n=1 Tax=Steinernema carpocapsae TaxID=34508 RepID=A0A4U5M2K4_STECR|nr:hypothetical protein L596_026853 [Steinernema carpocapsae]